MRPEIEKKGQSYYSLVQAREVFNTLKADPDLPPFWAHGCVHRCETHLFEMLNHGFSPHLLGRAYIAPAPHEGVEPGQERVSITDEKEKLTWASEVLKNRERFGNAIDLGSMTNERLNDWLGVRDVTKRWRFHAAAAITVWNDAVEKPVPLALDTALFDEPVTLQAWAKPMTGDMYIMHGHLGEAPHLIEPKGSMASIAMSPTIAQMCKLILQQDPDIHRMEPLEAEELAFAYRDMLRQFKGDGLGFEASLHPQTKTFIQSLEQAAKGRGVV